MVNLHFKKPLEGGQTSTTKLTTGLTATRYNALAKIINHLKYLLLNRKRRYRTLDELLHETDQHLVPFATKQWLQIYGLGGDPKIMKRAKGTKFRYKACHKLTTANDLLKLLRRFERNGSGGVLLQDVRESLPNSQKILKRLGNRITVLVNRKTKRKVLFYSDLVTSGSVDDDGGIRDNVERVDPSFVGIYRSLVERGRNYRFYDRTYDFDQTTFRGNVRKRNVPCKTGKFRRNRFTAAADYRKNHYDDERNDGRKAARRLIENKPTKWNPGGRNKPQTAVNTPFKFNQHIADELIEYDISKGF